MNMDFNEEREFIIDAVTRAKVRTVHPGAANTVDIGRAVLAAYRAKQTAPTGTEAGFDLDKRQPTDAEYQDILRPVLSRYGMQRFLNGDEITLNPSDYRAIIDRGVEFGAARRAAPDSAAQPDTTASASIADDEDFWALVATWIGARGTTRDHIAKASLVSYIDSRVPVAAQPCKHKRQSTTAFGAATNTGWTCKDCGALLSEQNAPDREQVAAQPVQAGEAVDESAEFDRLYPPPTTDMHCDEYDALVELRAVQWDVWRTRASLAPVSAQQHKAGIENTSVSDPIRDYDEFDNPLDGQMGD